MIQFVLDSEAVDAYQQKLSAEAQKDQMQNMAANRDNAAGARR